MVAIDPGIRTPALVTDNVGRCIDIGGGGLQLYKRKIKPLWLRYDRLQSKLSLRGCKQRLKRAELKFIPLKIRHLVDQLHKEVTDKCHEYEFTILPRLDTHALAHIGQERNSTSHHTPGTTQGPLQNAR